FRTSNNGQPQDGPGGQNQGFYFDNLTTAVYNNTDGTGNDLANVIVGNAGDNVLAGLGGNDTIDGAAGINTSLYRNDRGHYDATYRSDSHGLVRGFATVTDHSLGNNDGHDTLSNIQALQFADTTLDATARVQLFDGASHLIGTFTTIHDALGAAVDG